MVFFPQFQYGERIHSFYSHHGLQVNRSDFQDLRPLTGHHCDILSTLLARGFSPFQMVFVCVCGGGVLSSDISIKNVLEIKTSVKIFIFHHSFPYRPYTSFAYSTILLFPFSRYKW